MNRPILLPVAGCVLVPAACAGPVTPAQAAAAPPHVASGDDAGEHRLASFATHLMTPRR